MADEGASVSGAPAKTEKSAPLALRTAFGPVGLRQARPQVTMQIEGSGALRIGKGWLAGARGEHAYHRAVKQAMLVAAEQLRLDDAEEPMQQKFSYVDIEQIKTKLQTLLSGKQRIIVSGTQKKSLKRLVKKEDRQRDMLIKFSTRCCPASCRRRERSFIIDNGELVIYKGYNAGAKLKDSYKLKDATCFYETRSTAQVPKWEEGFTERIRVDCKERQDRRKNPLYLYSNDETKIQRWKRAFGLAKVLVAENDRRALKTSIGRATSGSLLKAWEALAAYNEEIQATKNVVKLMAMRLVKVDLSRGWTKLRLVYKKKEEEERRRTEQRVWAARFMSEKLAKLGSQNAKKASDVRESVITRIQRRFRRYREDMIFDRTYPLGSQQMSRVQLAKLGKMLDFAFSSVRADDAIRLSLSGPSLESWELVKDKLGTGNHKPTYSEVNIPVTTVCVYVSDNLNSLSFSGQVEDGGAYSALGKADWSKFINLDRISSIVLNSDPLMGAALPKDGQKDGGVWCTINGPRLGWDKRISIHEEKAKRHVKGSPDSFGVPNALAKSLPEVKWVHLTVTVGQATLELDSSPKESDVSVERSTYAVAHVLGWAFESQPSTGESPDYRHTFQASVPVHSKEEFVALDFCEVGVEVFELPAPSKEGQGQPTLLFVGTELLASVFRAGDDKTGPTLAEQIRAAQGPQEVRLRLRAPSAGHGAISAGKGEVSVSIQARLSDSKMEPETKVHLGAQDQACCLSPELIGGGVTTSLFTSHRGAWYDPDLGPGKFRPDHVANFVELCVGSLRFPASEEADKGYPSYRIQASMHGYVTHTVALHRPREAWRQVLGTMFGDPLVIKFQGSRLYLPLPPGTWGKGQEKRRQIRLQVLRCEEQKPSEKDFNEFIASAQYVRPDQRAQTKPKKAAEEVIYEAVLTFDHRMLVDQQKAVSLYLSKPGTQAMEVNVYTGAPISVAVGAPSEGILNLDFALRDRDHVKGFMGQSGDRRALCVGDKAMLIVEEPFLYPPTMYEFRKRFCPGQFSQKAAGKAWAGGRGAPLRDPCLSSEYTESGLGDIVPRIPFKQSFIPKFCADIIPHKYVLPLTERQFLDQHLPGFYHRILDDLVSHKEDRGRAGRPVNGGVARPVVKYLTHMNRQVPVTLLAVYADGTCDLEISPEFMESWQRQRQRKLAMPGMLVMAAASAAATPKANPAQQHVPRAVLKRVPTSVLHAVHYSGINVYDAKFKSTDDVLMAKPPVNDFNPCELATASPEDAHRTAKESGKQFRIASGPLPADASPAACQYEFCIRVRSPSDYEMHQFVAMIRRVVRMDHYQQASKMLEYSKRTTEGPVLQQAQRPIIGGQLDVVLIEARRLLPRTSMVNRLMNSDPTSLTYANLTKATVPIRSDSPIDDNYLPKLAGTTTGESTKGTPEGSRVNTFVNFRMLNNREVVPYRGQRVQQSPVIFGTDSPSWGQQGALQTNGGWTFKTGSIDPERLPDLIIDFEVMQAHVGFSSLIGAIQLPVTQRQFLTNPNEPFKNLWLPLVSVKDGKPVANPTGEIHIMTRWLPAEKMQLLADGSMKLQMSVRMMFLKEQWPKLAAQRLREPIYNLEVLYLNYNPNLVPPSMSPEAPKDHVRRHAEELANAVPYLECLERRQLQAWEEFEKELEEDERGARISEIRLLWMERENFEQLERLGALIQRGIPSSRRERLWAELTLSSRVMERDGVGGQMPGWGSDVSQAAEQEYNRLRERGEPQRSDAMQQLQEDAFQMSHWESATPPVPEVLDAHLRRIKKAMNVCTALLACEDSGIIYCESLLVIAFFLLLPQGCKEEKSPDDGTLCCMSESSAFWLLYTLICTRVNGTYREYYGTVGENPDDPSYHKVPSLVAYSGAMQDVQLLECCLAYHEPDLWQRLNALGFHLATIFYGAFMRLYATFIPTASVFRLWDILFAQSTDPKAQPHARAYLIDLAFGVLRSRKADLMNCQSALEVRHLILGVLGSLYDMSTVVDITMTADVMLWGGSGFSRGKIGNLWTQREELFSFVNATIGQQNETLKQLTHLLPLKFSNVAQARDETSVVGVTTKDLLREVLPVLQSSIDSWRPREPPQFWSMFRPMPLAGRVLCQNALEKVRNAFTSSLRLHPRMPPPPKMVRPPRPEQRPTETGSTTSSKVQQPGLEPLDVSASDLAGVLERDFPTWAPHATALWNAFTNRRDRMMMGMNLGGSSPYGNNPYGGMDSQGLGQFGPTDPLNPYGQQQNRGWLGNMIMQFASSLDPDYWGAATSAAEESDQVSLNELFIALICASRGTVGEKASALFNIYSYSDPVRKDTYHWTPVSRLARSIANASAESAQDAIGKSLAPPDPDSDDAKQNVLRFQVHSSYPNKDRTLLGSAFVPSLSPFVGYGTEDSQFSLYNIWGPMPDAAAKRRASGGVAQMDTGFICVGEICMAITWTPTSIRKPEEGQLCVNMKFVRFFSLYVSDYYKKNPWVTIQMCQETTDIQGVQSKNWVNIPRWQPRGLIANDKQHSWLTTHGAYGGHMIFEKTMKEGLLKGSESFSHYMRDGNQGWNPETKEWQWNEVWGKQHSVENLVVMPEFVRLSNRKNVMDIQGVRLLVSGIVYRCQLNLTNRQAILIADAIFNRQGAVPGILEAVIIQGDDTRAYKSMAELKEAKVNYVDVTQQLALEHERQVALNGGMINMFSEDYLMSEIEGGKVNLKKDMHLKDPFPDMPKVLWVRFVRGGDGERLTQAIRVQPNGDIDGSEELELELLDKSPQTKITKEEFISCVLNSPLLGESLRRLGSCDHVLHAKRSIPLDVTIMDPHHEEEDEQFNDAMNVQQSILFEVWDADVVGKEFLGEAWLPPLPTFGARTKDIVLPLHKADFTEDAENGPSHPGDNKEIGGDEKMDPTKKITGELYISVSWKYPVYEDKGLDQDVKTFLMDLSGTDNRDLLKYESAIVEHFGSVQHIAELMVNPDGELKAEFFKKCEIKDKNHQKKFSAFFKDHNFNESIANRADIQEKMHTGMLKIRIDQARNLRRAHKFRECDAQVQVWLRNDVKNAWRKKPFMRTSVVRNNRNPVWKFEQERTLLTGSYEARFREPEEGWVAEMKKAIRSRKEQRRLDEDRMVNAIKRFGSKGLKIRFRDPDARAPARSSREEEPGGDNHKVEVFLGDNLREFKQKLALACQREAMHWKSIRGEHSEEGQIYSDITIGYKHLVMVFVPSPKVLKLKSQRLSDGAEYERAYREAWNDPSSWQPLDPARSFAQYHQFGFGRQHPQQLRVVEATESYKTMNLRYKVFEEELTRQGFQDINDRERCFGWGKYAHRGDGSTEWRPSFISKSQVSGGTYTGRWIFEPGPRPEGVPPGAGIGQLSPSSPSGPGSEEYVDLDRTQVLLAPRCPKFDDQVFPEHKQYLDQAKLLRASGKSDWEIETVLNKLLDDKWDEYKAQNNIEDDSGKWPRITVDIIRAYLQRQQEQENKVQDGKTSTLYGQSGMTAS